MTTFDVLVIGAGPTGLAAAGALQQAGLVTCLVGEVPRHSHNSPDLRTAALFAGSIRMLKRLGAWPHLAGAVTPLAAIRVVDDTGHLLRAPEQLFHARDIGATELGYNILNPALVDALLKALRERAPSHPTTEPPGPAGNALLLGSSVTAIETSATGVAATLADGRQIAGRVAIAADGRRSMTRAAAGIAVTEWDRGQAAVTAHLCHTFPHDGISTELHGRGGPLTVVPIAPSAAAQNRSSLVWMETRETAAARAAAPDEVFIAELEARLHGLLGPITAVTPRRVFPLSSLIAERYAANRIALIGEAAHAFPPIGAQGLNLGLRDVAVLADELRAARRAGRDIGSDAVLTGYSEARRADVALRTYGVDAFNRSMSGRVSGLLRGAALHATRASPTLKSFMIERGLAPPGDWPSLMRA